MFFLLVFVFVFGVNACDYNFTQVVNSQRVTPLRGITSSAAYYWGRFLLYDLKDNGRIDASTLYGLGNETLLPNGDFYLTEDGLMPLVCRPGVLSRPTTLFEGGDTACCGVECSESGELLSIYVFLARLHNQRGRSYVVNLLRRSCPFCDSTMSNSSSVALLMAYYSTIEPLWTSGEVNGSPDPFAYCAAFSTKHRGILSAFGRRVTNELENKCDDLYSIMLEQAGPLETDVLGPLGRYFFRSVINVTDPVWLFNGVADAFLDSECKDYLESLEWSTNSGKAYSCSTTEGSLIFFTVFFGIVVIVFLFFAFWK